MNGHAVTVSQLQGSPALRPSRTTTDLGNEIPGHLVPVAVNILDFLIFPGPDDLEVRLHVACPLYCSLCFFWYFS